MPDDASLEESIEVLAKLSKLLQTPPTARGPSTIKVENIQNPKVKNVH